MSWFKSFIYGSSCVGFVIALLLTFGHYLFGSEDQTKVIMHDISVVFYWFMVVVATILYKTTGAEKRCEKYVVSATLKKKIPTGLNIINSLVGIEAKSEEEAIGKFILLHCEKNPEHDIHVRPVVWDLENDKFLQ